MKPSTLICLCLYYAIARHMPKSHSFLGRLTFAGNIRQFLWRRIFLKMGRNVNIERGAFFGKGTAIEVGDNSGLGVNCHLHPNTVIGSNVMMGPDCYMLDNTHKYDRTDIPMIEQGLKDSDRRCKVVIEDDVWIGREVMIIGNKIIKTGSIIGARCLLTKNFPPFSIVGGNPSRLIRSRQ